MGKKHSYEYVYNYFKENNCELLENNYIDSLHIMKYRCICGNISNIRFNNFKQGSRCKNCGSMKIKNKLSNSFEYVYNYFKEHGCELLENQYINNITIMKYKCICGIESYINFSNFQQGSRCRNCYIKNTAGKNNVNWKLDRTRKIRSDYLKFNIKNIDILKDDPNYYNYINNIGTQLKQNQYNIDHIYPRIAFIDNNLDEIYDIKIIKEICNLRENLQILPRFKNNSKHSKYIQEEFIKWFNEKYQFLYG